MLLYFFLESTTKELKIELDLSAMLLPQGLNLALDLGVDTGDSYPPTANTFLVAFLTKLLYQREKIELGLLDDKLPVAVQTSWRESLTILEDKSRKVIRIRDGSVIFGLFCPLKASCDQLQDRMWITRLRRSILTLFELIGVYNLKGR